MNNVDFFAHLQRLCDFNFQKECDCIISGCSRVGQGFIKNIKKKGPERSLEEIVLERMYYHFQPAHEVFVLVFAKPFHSHGL